MSEKIPPDRGGKSQSSGGEAGHAPEGDAGKRPAGRAESSPRAGYGRQGGNAGTHPRNKKGWEKP